LRNGEHPRPDEDGKRFDLLLLRIQLARLDGDAVTFERFRKQVQDICVALLGQTAIPSVKDQEQLLGQLAEDEWWVDVTLPMLELARRRVRGLVQFVDKTKRAIVYSNFADEVGESSIVELPGVMPGTNWERFRAKARAYLRTTRTTSRCRGCAATTRSPRVTSRHWRRC
jgi:type I restriction enzyme, R subunit